MRFRFVPKSTTLDDLERPLRALFQHMCVFGAYHKNLNEDRLTLSAEKCSPLSLVSGVYKFSTDIRVFAVCIFGNFRDKATIMIQGYGVCRWLSTDPKTRHLQWICYVKCHFHNDMSGVGDCDFRKQLGKNKSGRPILSGSPVSRRISRRPKKKFG